MSLCDGTWQLVPELSHYDRSGPPDWGTYDVRTVGGMVNFQVTRCKDGKDFAVSFAAPTNGQPVAGAFPGVDSFLVRQEGGALISQAFATGELVARASRRVAGDLISILQENRDGNGGWLRIWQVHRRM